MESIPAEKTISCSRTKARVYRFRLTAKSKAVKNGRRSAAGTSQESNSPCEGNKKRDQGTFREKDRLLPYCFCGFAEGMKDIHVSAVNGSVPVLYNDRFAMSIDPVKLAR